MQRYVLAKRRTAEDLEAQLVALDTELTELGEAIQQDTAQLQAPADAPCPYAAIIDAIVSTRQELEVPEDILEGFYDRTNVVITYLREYRLSAIDPETIHRRIVSNEDKLRRRQREKAALLREVDTLRSAPDTTGFTEEEATTFLETLPEYVHGSFRVTDSLAMFTLAGVRMTPSHNAYGFVNGGVPPAVRLPDMQVRIPLNSERPTYIQVRPWINGEGAPAFIGRRAAHPHVTDESGGTCLGDFLPVIHESTQQQDFNLTVVLFLAFLQQANADDTAGKYWIRFVDPDLNPRHTTDAPHFQLRWDEHPGMYTFTDDGRPVWVETPDATVVAKGYMLDESAEEEDEDEYEDEHEEEYEPDETDR